MIIKLVIEFNFFYINYNLFYNLIYLIIMIYNL